MSIHRGICNRLFWMQETYRLTAGTGFLQKTPFTFDVSVWEFFWPLMTGARLVVAKPGGHMDSAYLIRTIRDQHITTLHFVPSMLGVFLMDRDAGKCAPLKRVICSGEALSMDTQRRFFEVFANAELHNLYGPTEASVDVTYWKCERGSREEQVPIGRPVANTQIYILDEAMQPVDAGFPANCTSGACNWRAVISGVPISPRRNLCPIHSAATRRRGCIKRATSLGSGAMEISSIWDASTIRSRFAGFASSSGKSNLCWPVSGVEQCSVIAREDQPGDKRLVAYVVSRTKSQPARSTSI